ncbi:MAG TPA: glycosyltransferase, partial [Vicinamibacteria bacterium]|nr:glycosyltransferase [Vicinamibacteria bacterium]
AEADVVFATSTDLYARMAALNEATELVPNAADFAHFKDASRAPAPEDVRSLPRPILGYLGEIAPWFDLEAVHALAQARPSWSLVLVGPLTTRRAGPLLALPNVHYLGRKAYGELPGYLGQFDVCLLPFALTPLTAAVSPVKVYEYLAAGRPVVSSSLKEVLALGPLVTIAGPEGFAPAVEAALGTRGEAAVAQRQEFAQGNTWDHRVRAILRAFARVAPKGGAP